MNKLNQSFDVIIIGAGGAGLMCAIEAGKRGRTVAILEHNNKVGKKIRISGGGRCNFTNMHTTNENYLSNNSHFCKSAFARFTPQNFIDLVKKHKINFHEKKLGQLFCDDSAQNIIDMLVKEAKQVGVKIFLNTTVKSNIKHDNKFIIDTSNGTFESESIVIATGGLSIPLLGATDFGYRVAKNFGLKINSTFAGLVPFTFKGKEQKIFSSISGVSVDALVSFKKQIFRENILFTHKGLSGPAILQISSYWQPKKPIIVNLLPDENIIDTLRKNSKSKVMLKTLFKKKLPSRLVEKLCEHYCDNKPLNQYTSDQQNKIAKLIHQWKLIPSGTEGYKKAEVTIGGIDTNELSSKTMECKKQPGLYFIGEVVDVTGHLGGFNFQWAWASGYSAGQYV